MAKKPKHIKHLIGIDEVGRGPLAGPVTLCAFLVPYNDTLTHFRGVKDSKQLTVAEREEWHGKIREQRKSGRIEFALASVGPALIDERGLSWAINTAIKRCLISLGKKIDQSGKPPVFAPEQCLVLLDGSLKAPAEFIHQKTIIKGDEKVRIIALASIVAKVTRDRRMIRLAKEFPHYGFDIHKGYGTRAHYRALSAHGMCPLHRRSFLKKISEKI